MRSSSAGGCSPARLDCHSGELPVPISDVMRVRLVSVAPDETVQSAIARMVEAGVGSVAVCEGSRLVGIFTERDVLRLAGEQGGHDEEAHETMRDLLGRR